MPQEANFQGEPVQLADVGRRSVFNRYFQSVVDAALEGLAVHVEAIAASTPEKYQRKVKGGFRMYRSFIVPDRAGDGFAVVAQGATPSDLIEACFEGAARAYQWAVNTKQGADGKKTKPGKVPEQLLQRIKSLPVATPENLTEAAETLIRASQDKTGKPSTLSSYILRIETEQGQEEIAIRCLTKEEGTFLSIMDSIGEALELTDVAFECFDSTTYALEKEVENFDKDMAAMEANIIKAQSEAKAKREGLEEKKRLLAERKARKSRVTEEQPISESVAV